MTLSAGTQSLIAGALYDFVAHLTGLPKPIHVGAPVPVYDALEALQKWAFDRGLDLGTEPNLEWNKTAASISLEELLGEDRSVPHRIAGALKDFGAFVKSSESTDYETLLVKWATRTGLSLANPQLRWAAHWWA